MNRIIILILSVFLLTACDLPKADTTNLTGQGRNYIYFECSTDSIQKGGDNGLL